MSIAADIAESLPPQVVGDSARLRQVLLNLAGNAIKFTETGGIGITIAPGVAVDEIAIEVCDTGIGIAPDDQTRVFLEFEQADNGAARKFGRTGYLVKPIRAASLAARIASDHALDGIVTTARLARPTNASPPRRKLSILVAEDNEINALLARALLARLGHDHVIASSGIAALDTWDTARAAGKPFDLVLMDLHMPVLTGLRPHAASALRKPTARPGPRRLSP